MSPRARESHSTKGLKPTQRVDSHCAFMTVLMVIGQEALGAEFGGLQREEETTHPSLCSSLSVTSFYFSVWGAS